MQKKIMAAVGKPVRFKYPGTEGDKVGTLKDRVVLASNNPEDTGVPYWDVIDLIEFPEEKESLWIRIGYYRKPKDRLVWGSQTTITEPLATWKLIFLTAAKEKPWFRKIFEEVFEELKTPMSGE